MHNSDQTNNHRHSGDGKGPILLSLAIFVVGVVGYIAFSRGGWISYAFAHLGALGLMGLFGSTAGRLAERKQRSYKVAFLLGSLLPIVAGLLAVLVLWLPEGGQLYCGGSVCLLVAIVVTVVYLAIRKKTPRTTSEAIS